VTETVENPDATGDNAYNDEPATPVAETANVQEKGFLGLN